uniref:Uncharacterized protein n=1 Tax=Erpetoichthys calabaricus TaxID=27687 RepID=A0A8C4RFE9_ERPCA
SIWIKKGTDIAYTANVCTLVSSAKWLKQHGLQENKITITQILSQIGFKHKEDYVRILQKPVSSQYAEGLFSQCQKNGEIYNIIATREQLHQIVDLLSKKIQLYEKRLEWLTSGSRQIFGVIQERSITIALDFGITSHSHYKLCCNVVCNVLKEQVSQIARFNLICNHFIYFNDAFLCLLLFAYFIKFSPGCFVCGDLCCSHIHTGILMSSHCPKASC